uniref:(northern house mosquito) hypothetical protein n=1 Tax=Culex pipiens TaxID=7175 RepID=A0A8D8HED7_CULPI
MLPKTLLSQASSVLTTSLEPSLEQLRNFTSLHNSPQLALGPGPSSYSGSSGHKTYVRWIVFDGFFVDVQVQALFQNEIHEIGAVNVGMAGLEASFHSKTDTAICRSPVNSFAIIQWGRVS